jgi:ferredoxin
MQLKQLKKIRIVISLLVFVVLLLLFLGFETGFISTTSEIALRLQFIPSILRFLTLFFSITALGFLLVILITFLFGRVYCSSICPLGTFQDIVSNISMRFRKKKNRKFKYSSNQNNLLKYGLLGATIVLWFLGSLFLVNLLDPFSNFGKISVSFFHPAYIFINNQLSAFLQNFEVYSVAPIADKTLPLNVLMVSSVIMLTIVAMSAWRGRLFCNTICPVGSFLGLISSKSLFKIKIDNSSCTLCGKCEHSCKAQCIDFKSQIVDQSRCVGCFNCFAVCNDNAMKYTSLTNSENVESLPATNGGKRKFLLTLAGMTLSIPLLNKKGSAKGYRPGMIPTATALPVTPPGSQGYDHFTSKCVACYLCVGACPKDVIVPSFFDYGLEGFMQPKLDFNKSFCNYDCVRCTEVCPTGAIIKQTPEQKQLIQIGVARFIMESCVVVVDRTACGACSEHCPTKAVEMIEWDHLRIPFVNSELCIGCGACEFACPTEPFKAIYVESNQTHLKAIPIDQNEGPREEILDDFPF